jgi:hypothetical protein
MAVIDDPLFEDEKNCVSADLDVNGFPPTSLNGKTIQEGTWMYVYSAGDTTGELVSIFKMVFGSWKKRYSVEV